MASRSDSAVFRRALPVLGRDGTLSDVQSGSPAVGHVRAKTGTSAAGDRLHHSYVLTSKALAGYVTTADGRDLTFAFFLNGMPGTEDVAAGPEIAGEALGELATALYRLPVRIGGE
jgi:D-alanyl-D-alanine carboxypeptidase/D-alanyl-D-alanine-endopeptidase (penicillin-binding protein 4)